MANEIMTISSYMTLPKIKSKIIDMVGTIDAPRFMSSVTSAVGANPALQECSNASIFNAALLGESLKLSPSPQLGQVYIVPYKNKKTGETEAQFQLGYKGYIQLAIRSGQYKKLNAVALKEGELLNWDPLNEEISVNLIADERKRELSSTIGYYAMFEYSNGFKKALYWNKEKMISHADKYSQAFSIEGYEKIIKGIKYKVVSFEDYEAGDYDKKYEWLYSSFWYKDFDAMAMKTMLRQLISKWGIMSIDLQTAYTNDEAVIKDVTRDSVQAVYIDEEEKIKNEANNGGEIGLDDIQPTPALTVNESTPANLQGSFEELAF